MVLDFDCVNYSSFEHFIAPLGVDEVVDFLRKRWGASYDMRLVQRNKKLYLQLMWAYLEQQSFPLDEVAYRKNLNKVVEIINRLGQAGIVRQWLLSIREKPRLGRAITLQLKADYRLKEFVL